MNIWYAIPWIFDLDPPFGCKSFLLANVGNELLTCISPSAVNLRPERMRFLTFTQMLTINFWFYSLVNHESLSFSHIDCKSSTFTVSNIWTVSLWSFDLYLSVESEFLNLANIGNEFLTYITAKLGLITSWIIYLHFLLATNF